GSGSLAPGPEASGEDRHIVQIARERADQLGAGDGNDLRRLRDTHLSLAPRDDLRRLGTRYEEGLGLHLIGNAEPVQDLREIDSARAALGGIGLDDRLD